MSKIEQCIDDLEAYFDGCKAQAFSNNKKIVVDRDEIDEILTDLRDCTPEEIKKYQRIVSNQDAILNHAKEQAHTTIAEAQDVAKDEVLKAKKQATELVDEHIITQKAYKRANEILEDAKNEAQRIVNQAGAEADNLRSKTINYADDIMATLQQLISSSMSDFRVRFDHLSKSLENSYNFISKDRMQLTPEKVLSADESSENEYYEGEYEGAEEEYDGEN